GPSRTPTVSPTVIVAAAATKPAASQAPTVTATPEGSAYTVKDGDTLSGIASGNGTSIDAIVKANNLTDPDKLQVGQKLVLPPPSSPPPASAGASAKPAASGSAASTSSSGSPSASRPPPP